MVDVTPLIAHTSVPSAERVLSSAEPAFSVAESAEASSSAHIMLCRSFSVTEACSLHFSMHKTAMRNSNPGSGAKVCV